MNRGKMKKVLALMLTFIFVISATACGGATKFDAEAYVRGVMDANYKQKYDEYAKARGISEKDAKAEIEDTLDEQVDTELSGLEALGDFTEEEKQEYKDMLVKIDNLAKYEVKEAKEDKDGNFTVTIEVTPSDVYQTLEDNSTAVAQEMMDQGQDVSQADASMFQDLLISLRIESQSEKSDEMKRFCHGSTGKIVFQTEPFYLYEIRVRMRQE